jgi:enoyl-CoA hydratase/carnithine racemase
MTDDISLERDGKVATLTLNRPDARNAFTDEMVEGIQGALAELDRDDSVHVLVTTGAGSSYSAGGDLKAMKDRAGMFSGGAADLKQAYERGLQRNTRAFDKFTKPVVAAVNGHAIGAGLGFALMADIRVVSSRAKLGATFANVGLVPGDGSAYLLTRAIGFSRAVELVLTARVFDADEAYRLGIAHHVVDSDAVLDKAMEVAQGIADLPPTAVQLAKSLMYRGAQGDLETALQLAASFQSAAQTHPEHLAAVEAMLDKISK